MNIVGELIFWWVPKTPFRGWFKMLTDQQVWALKRELIAGLILALVLPTGAGIAMTIAGLPFWMTGLVILGTTLVAGFWFVTGFEVVGGGRVRYVAIKTTFGRPTSLVRVGLAFRVRPFQQWYKIPTGKFWWEYELEGHTKDRWWVKVIVRVDFNWPTPDPDDPSSDPEKAFFPFVPDRMTKAGRGLSWPEASNTDATQWEKKSSWFLLRRAFYRFPGEPMGADYERLADFFEGAITGPILTILGETTRAEFVEHQEEIEAAARVMALSEQGDPLVDVGIPSNSLNIKIRRVEPLTPGAKESLEAPERAENTGKAHQTSIWHQREAAPNEAARIEAIVDAFKAKGVHPIVAAVLASGQIHGETRSPTDLAMLRLAFGGFDPGSATASMAAAATQQEEGQRTGTQ